MVYQTNSRMKLLMELSDLLLKLGLTTYETKAYTTLLLLGPSKAGKISKESGVPQSKIYSVLEKLEEKQLIETLNGRPKEFKAVKPKFALLKLIQTREDELNKLKSSLKLLLNNFKRLEEGLEVDYGIWTMKSKKLSDFLDKAAEMVRRSKKYVFFVSNKFFCTSSLSKSLKNCVKRGVSLKLISLRRPDSNNYYAMKWFKEIGAKVRIYESEVHPRIFLIDGRETLMQLEKNRRIGRRKFFHFVWTKEESFVNLMDQYVKKLWNEGVDVVL